MSYNYSTIYRAVLVQMSKAAYPTKSSPSKPATTSTSGASGDQRQPALTRREQKSTTSPSQRRVAVSVHTQKEPVLENDSKVAVEESLFFCLRWLGDVVLFCTATQSRVSCWLPLVSMVKH